MIIPVMLIILNAGNESPLYSFIQSNLNKYRQSIDSDDFSFQNGIIRFELDSRRTNIKSQLLLGFYSVGMGLQKIDVYCREIEIVIRYKMKVDSHVSFKSPVNKVMELSQGRLSPDQFFIQIGY